MNYIAQYSLAKAGNGWVVIGRWFLFSISATFPLAFAGFFYWNQEIATSLCCLALCLVLLFIACSDIAILNLFHTFDATREFVPIQFRASLRGWSNRLVHIFIAAAVFYWFNTGLFYWNQVNTLQDAHHNLNVFEIDLCKNCRKSLVVPYEACIRGLKQDPLRVQYCNETYTFQSNCSLSEYSPLVELCLDEFQYDLREQRDRLQLAYNQSMQTINPFVRNPFRDYSRFLNGMMDSLNQTFTVQQTRAQDFISAWLVWGTILLFTNIQPHDWITELFAFIVILWTCNQWTQYAPYLEKGGQLANALLDITRLPGRMM